MMFKYFRTIPSFLAILSAVGFALAAWLTYIHVRVHLDPMYESACAVGRIINCESVAASRFSVIANLPVSVLAAVFYLVLGGLSIAAWVCKDHRNAGLLAGLGLIAALNSIVFFTLSTVFIGAICLGCLGIHLVNILLAVQGVRHARAHGGLAKAVISDFRALSRNWFALVLIGSLAVLFAVAGPFGGFPRYWETASWLSGVPFHHGFEAGDLPWLGAKKPTTVVHEFFDYECPACRASHKKLRRLLSDRSSQLRLVRHDMSRVECINEKGAPIEDRCVAARAAFCAGMQDHFWEFNDAFIADPRPGELGARREHVLKLAERLGFDKRLFSKCMDRPETISHAENIHLDGLKRGVQSTPTYFAADKKMNAKQLYAFIRSL